MFWVMQKAVNEIGYTEENRPQCACDDPKLLWFIRKSFIIAKMHERDSGDNEADNDIGSSVVC